MGDTVLVRDYRTGSRKGIWKKGKILEELSPVTYKVMVENDIKWKRHIDQLRIFKNEDDQLISSEDSLVPEVEFTCLEPVVTIPEENDVNREKEEKACDPSSVSEGENLGAVPVQSNVENSTSDNATGALPKLRRSTRIKKPPDYLRM